MDLTRLREEMRRESIDAFIFPSTDPHNGEYVPDHWKGREWVSGFNGSAGTAVVTLHEAALWTDSRYFIAAEEQLRGTEFVLMREKMPETPTIKEWVAQKLAASGGTCVGIDGMVMAASDVEDYIAHFRRSGITVRHNYDPLKVVWTDRPDIPLGKVEIQPLSLAGESTASKLERIRKELRKERADWHLVTALDDIAWTLNLRGSDVHCCPVFVSYLLIGMDSVTLFVDSRKLTTEVSAYLAQNGVDICPYLPLQPKVKVEGTILMDPDTTCYSLFNSPFGGRKDWTVRSGKSPIPAMKIVKNETEIAGFRSAMLKDGVAMVRFLRWIDDWKAGKNAEDGPMTELTIDHKLTSLRAEQDGFRDISFDTIAAHGEHGAIVHYEPTPDTDVPLQRKSFLLLDSGAQYCDGTTDITRTIPLGPLTDEERRVYTLVFKGHIDLAMAKFPDGASGTQVDILARQHLWREGMNYLHGTGHGVGSYLNVHEGPHQFRMEWKPQPLRAGMTITNEPVLYLAGRFGVRIENTMLITPYMETEFGKFLQLESLTLCPYQLEPVIIELLTAEEIDYINDYHKRVLDTLLPHLTDERDRQWLKENARMLQR